MIPECLRKDIEAILQEKKKQGVPTRSKFYPGTSHGWTIRGDPDDPKQAKDAADAFAEIVSWLKIYAA